LTLVLLPLLAGALAYSLLSIVAAFHYLRVRPPALAWTEPISILKPLSGLDDGLEANLSTFLGQDYPAFEIWSHLEATGLNADFLGGILVARILEGMKFAVGGDNRR
jgi:hypothetical protein